MTPPVLNQALSQQLNTLLTARGEQMETVFWWSKDGELLYQPLVPNQHVLCPAPLSSEVGKILPVTIQLDNDEVYLVHWLNGDGSLWSSAYKTFNNSATRAYAFTENEADTRGTLLIYLANHGLLPVTKKV
jgi:hypothetical protein